MIDASLSTSSPHRSVNERRDRRHARLRERLHDRWRLLVILRRVGPLAISFARDQRRWVRFGAPLTRTPAFHARRAARLVRHVAALGPAFVKLAQIFASRSDLIAEPYLSALGTLTDQVPPIPWTSVHRVLTDAWDAAPESVVDQLDPAPLAAGSLGQVHRARYRGRDVVVKVLRPGVGDVVDRDVRLARALVAWMYRRFPHHHVLGFRVVLDEFAAHVHEEMDFLREGRQCERMRIRFLDEPRLRIPIIETALSRPDVLVMEYLPGTRIDSLQDRVARGDVRVLALVETLIECYARMMLRDGVFHADPHPGNLLVDAEGRIILLDFGMVIDVDIDTRKALFNTILAAISRNVDATTDGFFALNLVAPGTERATMAALVRVLLDIAFAQTAMQDRSRALAERILKELFDWPIVLPGELVYFARTAALIEGIGARYDANFNGIRVASPVVLRLRNELLVALLGNDAKSPAVSLAATLGAAAGGASVIVARAARRFSENVASVFADLFADQPVEKRAGSGQATQRSAGSASVPVSDRSAMLEDPLPKQIESQLHPHE